MTPTQLRAFSAVVRLGSVKQAAAQLEVSESAVDLDVELSVCNPAHFESLLLTRTVDVTVGPQPAALDPALIGRPVMNYRIVLVVAPSHPLAGGQ